MKNAPTCRRCGNSHWRFTKCSQIEQSENIQEKKAELVTEKPDEQTKAPVAAAGNVRKGLHYPKISVGYGFQNRLPYQKGRTKYNREVA